MRYLKTFEAAKAVDARITEEDFNRMANDRRRCYSCRRRPAWRYAETGLCFTCTTGESDSSNDYEIGKR